MFSNAMITKLCFIVTGSTCYQYTLRTFDQRFIISDNFTFLLPVMTFKSVQIILFAAIFLLQYFFEHVYPQSKECNNWKAERRNITTGLVNLVLVIPPAAVMVWLLQMIDLKNWGLLQQWSLPFWATLMITVFLLDMWMYAWHRLNHTRPFLWRFHRFHHTDETMNTTTAIRFHFLELFFSYFGKAIVFVLAGLSYTPVLIYELAFFASIVVHHSNINISEAADKVYRSVFASPRMHRIHHSVKQQERDSNYGSVFSFWDNLFGTAVYTNADQVKFGVNEEEVIGKKAVTYN